MAVEATRKRFTVDEYYRMAEVGILGPEDRVELIDGEIITMSPIGPRHSGCVNRANEAFTEAFRGRAVVSPQHPVRLSRETEPEPDLAVLEFRSDYYSSKTPGAGDVCFLVEVSDTTLAYDRDVKLPRYAAAGVPEVWIVNLREDVLLVCREPEESCYTDCRTLGRGDSVSPARFPDTQFAVQELIGD